MKKLMIFFCLLTAMIVGGCTQEDSLQNPQDNGEFLSLPANTDFSDLQDSDWEVIIAALGRINLKEDKDGKLILTPKSAAAANMSENLYEFIKSVIKKHNDDLMFGPLSSRSDFESNGEGDINFEDACVSFSISGARSDVDFEYAYGQITYVFGNRGVPYDQIENALSMFGPVEVYEPTGAYEQSLDRCVVICPAQGHATTGVKIENGVVICRDWQAIKLKELKPDEGLRVYLLWQVKIYRYK